MLVEVSTAGTCGVEWSGVEWSGREWSGREWTVPIDEESISLGNVLAKSLVARCSWSSLLLIFVWTA
jgi:hypothetical protein